MKREELEEIIRGILTKELQSKNYLTADQFDEFLVEHQFKEPKSAEELKKERIDAAEAEWRKSQGMSADIKPRAPKNETVNERAERLDKEWLSQKLEEGTND